MRSLSLLFASIAVILVASAVSLPIYTLMPVDNLLEFGKFTKWLAILGIAALVTYSVRKRTPSAAVILGFSPPPPHIPKCLTLNFLVGLALLSSYALVLYSLGLLIPEEHYAMLSISRSIASAFLVAFLIALIEETYFRGALLHDFQLKQHTVTALLLPAVFYAALHAFNVDGNPQADSPWYYGLTLLFEAPVQTCTETNCLGAGGVLVLFGIFLAARRLAGATLYTCIGIHAGAIVAIKATKKLSDLNLEPVSFELAGILSVAEIPDYFIWLGGALWLLPCCIWAIRRIPQQQSIVSSLNS